LCAHELVCKEPVPGQAEPMVGVLDASMLGAGHRRRTSNPRPLVDARVDLAGPSSFRLRLLLVLGGWPPSDSGGVEVGIGRLALSARGASPRFYRVARGSRLGLGLRSRTRRLGRLGAGAGGGAGCSPSAAGGLAWRSSGVRVHLPNGRPRRQLARRDCRARGLSRLRDWAGRVSGRRLVFGASRFHLSSSLRDWAGRVSGWRLVFGASRFRRHLSASLRDWAGRVSGRRRRHGVGGTDRQQGVMDTTEAEPGRRRDSPV
jgi:hypothetical protein